MSGAVEGECIEYMMERPSKDPLVKIQCIVLEHILIRIPLKVYIYVHIYILRLLFLST